MELVCKKTGRALVATLRGELDHHNAAYVRTELEDRFSSIGMRNLIFDLSELRFMDSSGLAVIMGRYRMCSRLGAELSVANLHGSIQKVLMMSGFQKYVKIKESSYEIY